MDINFVYAAWAVNEQVGLNTICCLRPPDDSAEFQCNHAVNIGLVIKGASINSCDKPEAGNVTGRELWCPIKMI